MKSPNRPLQQAMKKIAAVMNTADSPLPKIVSRNQYKVVCELIRHPSGLSEAELKLISGVTGVSDAVMMLNANGWGIAKRDGKFLMPEALRIEATSFLGGFL